MCVRKRFAKSFFENFIQKNQLLFLFTTMADKQPDEKKITDFEILQEDDEFEEFEDGVLTTNLSSNFEKKYLDITQMIASLVMS